MSRQNIFSKNKTGYSKLLWILPFILLVLGFGVYVNSFEDNNDKTDVDSNIINDEINQISNYENIATSSDKINTNDITNSKDIINMKEVSKNQVINEETSAYYLLKEVNGIIKLYHYDEEGNEHLLTDTDIIYSLISKNDQESFSNGVILKNLDQVNLMLQDFES